MRRAHCRLGITHTLRLDNCELINAVQGQKITRRMLVSARHERAACPCIVTKLTQHDRIHSPISPAIDIVDSTFYM